MNTIVAMADGLVRAQHRRARVRPVPPPRTRGSTRPGRDALIFGAGGAARACALALARGGAAAITVAAREPARGGDVSAALDGLGTASAAVAFDEAAGELAPT